MQVVDASAIVDLLVGNPRGAVVARLLAADVVAPELIDVEVFSALRRRVDAGLMSGAAADAAVARLARLDVERITHAVLDAEAWALRHRIRIADAFYVACALVFRAPLLTCDARLGRAPLPGVTLTVVQ